ncbi:hypothetical protein Pyn_40513 [Prunus yedoensis var. nudiflora]|uniref:Uncharacterized protein n=1 Tax=Prunus yedoensis var. nudiflora TaxID=2094558 RepID=A0A314YSI6_PRUYE|nr:hypothetical protein Pyn_40513 [Prunus yedoensis var. nudiflora]
MNSPTWGPLQLNHMAESSIYMWLGMSSRTWGLCSSDMHGRISNTCAVEISVIHVQTTLPRALQSTHPRVTEP